MLIGLVVTELCCHKINMNAKEKHIIQRILKDIRGPSKSVFCNLVTWCEYYPHMITTQKAKTGLQQSPTMTTTGGQSGPSQVGKLNVIELSVCLSVCPDHGGVVGFLVHSSNHLLATLWFVVYRGHVGYIVCSTWGKYQTS